MHIDYNDPVVWLEHRYASDEAARNPSIEKKFIKYFSERDSMHIMDAGAGTGSNFRYFFSKLADEQHWILLEQDAGLVAACREKLIEFASKHQYRVEEQAEQITIRSEYKSAHIQFLRGKLQDIKDLTDLKQLDVVTANALFDLVSYEQFDTFASEIACYQVCLMATLNYYETSFLPFSAEDGSFIQHYHTHMMRPQDFGAAMGPNCTEEMLDLLAAHEMKCEQEGSQWHLKRYDTTMQYYILQFMEHAIKDLNFSGQEVDKLEAWILEKRQMSLDHQLEIIVDHSDIFAYP
jgi:hypothetical protein